MVYLLRLLVICQIVATLSTAFSFDNLRSKSIVKDLTPSKLASALLIGYQLHVSSLPSPAFATSLETGKQLFTQSCAGCHAGGGNAIPFQGSKTLFLKDLTANGFNSEAKIVEIINKGKGSMMAFGSFTSQKGNLIPARFTDAEMADIASYVLDRASVEWKGQ